MKKILKPYTIVPDSLYVERDADRQLNRVLEDMGRPGYILVSRQMGKTNLLLYAKRKYSKADDIFVYIDLSNPFETVGECFQNIVDTIIDTTELLTETQINKIYEIRRNTTSLPAHKVHINELRSILKSVPGKLVIILDEIDALTKTNYSDLIFSQIRSIYFSRANYNELDRLTYILSGVVEPSEIIKDPKISPFNIGQKIFLDDFSYEEFRTFIYKAKLEITDEIIDRIYYWTNGNPRITWDLCSEVESLLLEKKLKKNLVNEDIDNIVNVHYLTSFDKPPVDNIREIIKKDKEIRNALIEIRKNKNFNIPDTIKSRLYLAGIVNYFDQAVGIKNLIIDRSIGNDWLNDIEIEDKGKVDYAIELYQKLKYEEALTIFETYLQKDEFPLDKRSLAYYYMGQSAYSLKQYEKAIIYLSKTNFSSKDSRRGFLYNTAHLSLSRSYKAINKIDECFNELMAVVDSKHIDDAYFSAKLFYGTLLGETNRMDEAKNIFEELITEELYSNIYIEDSFKNQLKSLSYYNLANIYIIQDNFALARESLLDSIRLSSIDSLPEKYLSLYEILEDEVGKFQILSTVNSLIQDSKLLPLPSRNDQLIYSRDDILKLLAYSYIQEDKSVFNSFSNYYCELENCLYGECLINLFYYCLNNKLDLQIVLLIDDLYLNRSDNKYSLSDENKLLISKIYASRNVDSPDAIEAYIKLFSEVEQENIDAFDFHIFMYYLSDLLKNKKLNLLRDTINLINAYKSKVKKELALNYLIIQNFELQYYDIIGDDLRALEVAYSVLNNIDKTSNDYLDSSLLDQDGLQTIRDNALEMLSLTRRKKIQIKVDKIFGRNQIIKVQYKNGELREAKYKKLEQDILNNRCFVID